MDNQPTAGLDRSQGVHRGPASRTLSRRPSRAEPGTWRGTLWILVVAADLFLMSNPLVFVADMDRALTLAAMITGAALVLTFPRVRAPRVAWPVLLFLGWLLLSATWSIQPTFTVAAWAQTTMVAAVAAAIYSNVTARVLVSGFLVGGVVVTASSLYAFHQRLPGAFYESLTGPAISGVGTNPNILAYTLVLSVCAACTAVPRGIWERAAWLFAVVFVTYGLIAAESATGNVTAAVVALSAVVLALYGPVGDRFLKTRARRIAAILAVMGALFGAYLVVSRALGQALLTFSDRTPLWSAAIAVAQERPWRGFGYGAVWQHPWKPPLLNIVTGEIWDASGLPLSHGHNSAIDLLVEVGIVGVLLMMLVMATAALRPVLLVGMAGHSGIDGTMMARFTALCWVALVVFGITEPMSTIPLGWWALVLLTEPRPLVRWIAGRHGGRSTKA